MVHAWSAEGVRLGVRWMLPLCLGAVGCTQTVHALEDVPLVEVARSGVASQSSNAFDARLAIDGNAATFSATTGDSEVFEWWEVALARPELIRRVVLWNRKDCCQGRARDLNVVVLEGPSGAKVFDYQANSGKLLNPANVLCGPERFEIDLFREAPALVKGSVIRVERRLDQPQVDASLCALANDTDTSQERHTLSFSEVEVWAAEL
ncbi:MAG: discoidin domain-containing protein [Polyangiaceae bacterium]|nr:discoidin domain-containing protein [Polyangiaceae bacterium]